MSKSRMEAFSIVLTSKTRPTPGPDSRHDSCPCLQRPTDPELRYFGVDVEITLSCIDSNLDPVLHFQLEYEYFCSGKQIVILRIRITILSF